MAKEVVLAIPLMGGLPPTVPQSGHLTRNRAYATGNRYVLVEENQGAPEALRRYSQSAELLQVGLGYLRQHLMVDRVGLERVGVALQPQIRSQAAMSTASLMGMVIA
jgi:hypothetical protein